MGFEAVLFVCSSSPLSLSLSLSLLSSAQSCSSLCSTAFNPSLESWRSSVSSLMQLSGALRPTRRHHCSKIQTIKARSRRCKVNGWMRLPT
ncbi:hypothetical protein GBA52_026944 [Prunus armeniaca]|nr:hypothetical protein GBA52_026944 [Prunus armeniaca]